MFFGVFGMATYIWWSFGVGCFGIALRLLVLAFQSYPRTIKYDRWEDVLVLLISSAFVIWAWSVLHT